MAFGILFLRIYQLSNYVTNKEIRAWENLWVRLMTVPVRICMIRISDKRYHW